jgi:hypothetical protein
MALSLIGAGFGRTGTLTIKTALEMIGFGPCHHMGEVLANPSQRTLWRGVVASGQPPEWETILAGYKSAVDWPSAHYWRELSQFYPSAKIILTVRSSESWYASFSKTILPHIVEGNDPETLGVKLINKVVFGGRPDDRAHAISVYEKNNSDVQKAFSGDRLLVYELGAGWEPLCRFLDVPIPEAAFPRTNSAEDFGATIGEFRRRGAEQSQPA